VGGVDDVEDPVDVVAETLAGSGKVKVAASTVEEAMYSAHSAAVPLRELLGSDRVADVPDDDALLEGVFPLAAVQPG